MNRLNSLPRGFGGFLALEVLDLTYNNLNEKSLPGNFCQLGKLQVVHTVFRLSVKSYLGIWFLL